MSTTAATPPMQFGRMPSLGPNPRPQYMSISTDPLRLSMMVLIILTISRIHSNFPTLSAARPGVLATALVAGYAFLNPGLLAKGNLFRTWPAKLILGFFILACLSVAFGMEMGNSGKSILDSYIKTVVFAFLIVACVRNVKDLYTLGWAIVISAGTLAYTAVFIFQLKAYDAYARLDNLYLYDSNDVGCVLTASLAFSILYARTAKPLGRILSIAIFILMFVAIARTGSRGAMIGLIVAGIGLLFLARGVSVPGRLAIVGIAFAALSAWAPRGYWEQMATILNPTQDYNYTEATGRKQVAERGLKYMQMYPVFGVGINNFPKAECTFSDYAVKKTGPAIRCSAPHNSYVEAGAELGIPGLILWLTFILGGIIGPIVLRHRMPRHWQRGDAEERFLYQSMVFLPVTFLSYAFASFFITFAFMDFTYFLMAFLAGLYVATEFKLRQNIVYPPPPAQADPERERRSRRPRQPVSATAYAGSPTVPISE